MTPSGTCAAIRRRTPRDLDGAVRLASTTHQTDGYPRFLPTDLPAFVAPAEELAAWVAVDTDTDTDTVVAHVSLHDGAADPAVADLLESVTGTPADTFALVARLLVSPGHRGTGLGRRLIDTAMAGATDLGRQVALDVDQAATGPIALYEKLGWTRIGAVEITVHDDHRLALWVYLPGI